MILEKNVANAVGGKTARACDSCIRKRARWFCAADDAFLCQACDTSVHSANPLARRHERVRLKTASLKLPGTSDPLENSMPTWHQGFTRKARTPRHGKPAALKSEDIMTNPLPFVPDMGGDETSYDDNEEQLLYRVPIFDPFVAELRPSTTSNDAALTTVANDAETADVAGGETKALVTGHGHDADSFHGFLPSEMDLAEFAADVESLLGKGLDNESFGMEGLGLVDCKEESVEYALAGGTVKLEDEEDDDLMCRHAEAQATAGDAEMDMGRSEPFELNFDYEEEEEKVVAVGAMDMNDKVDDPKKRNKILLSLDYESIIIAWATQGSPWTNGHRPELDPDDCWPDCLGTCGIAVHRPYGDYSGMGEAAAAGSAIGDGGREARVSRYREKRRTRLFSKKIRYEVRKLNAEKRPRMKGRFVKRASFGGGGGGGGGTPPFALHNK